MKESDIQSRILNVLRRLDSFMWVERNNVGELKDDTGRPVTYGLGAGSADVECSVAPLGLVLWLEVKKPKKNQAPHQLVWAARQNEVASARPRGNVFKVRTVDEAVAAVLDTYRWGLDLLVASGRMEAAAAEAAYKKAEETVARAKVEAATKEEARTERKKRTPKRRPVPASASRATTF